jgi:hypothetical protein
VATRGEADVVCASAPFVVFAETSSVWQTRFSNNGAAFAAAIRAMGKVKVLPAMDVNLPDMEVTLPDGEVTVQRGEVVHTGGHLEMPEGVHWPLTSSRVLFVRPFFAPLYESVLKELKPASESLLHRHVVTGQPGIGKSVFGCVGARVGVDASARGVHPISVRARCAGGT